MKVAGKLIRIVLNECHIMLIQREFKWNMKRLKNMIKCVNMQLILLTEIWEMEKHEKNIIEDNKNVWFLWYIWQNKRKMFEKMIDVGLSSGKIMILISTNTSPRFLARCFVFIPFATPREIWIVQFLIIITLPQYMTILQPLPSTNYRLNSYLHCQKTLVSAKTTIQNEHTAMRKSVSRSARNIQHPNSCHLTESNDKSKVISKENE